METASRCEFCKSPAEVIGDEGYATCSTDGCLANGVIIVPAKTWNRVMAEYRQLRAADMALAWRNARMAFRTSGDFEEVPGMLLKLGGDDCFVYEDLEEFCLDHYASEQEAAAK